ncbi:MAG: hypothetical protein AB4063_09780 [Crocosphaera sp.]
MSIQRSQLETALSTHVPQEILEKLLDEYQEIKKQFLLRKFRPSELNAARFSECVLRLIEYLHTGNYTPFGTNLRTQNIINSVGNNQNLPKGIRFFFPNSLKFC